MKQIKTIVYKLDDVSVFDVAVNALLEKGWEIIERKVLQPTTPPPAIGPCPPTLLYAAMERYILGEDEKDCENCKHCDLPPDAAPCRDCSDEADKWEPAEGLKLKEEPKKGTPADDPCDNCKYEPLDPDDEPCGSCNNGDKWELAEGEV